MIGVAIFVAFAVLMLAGVPIGVALMLAGSVGIGLADLGWLSIPNNFYAGIAKYPLLALPMFVLVGSIFDRSGVAQRLVNFALAIVGRGPGMLPMVAIGVAMFLGGISGSGPANAAAVGGVMLAAMARAGYPPAYSASVIGAAAATDILIPPSIAFIVYSVLVPGASVPALFAAGLVPGALVGVALIVIDAALGAMGKLRIPPLAVGIGIYLPMSATFAVVVGAVVSHWYDGRSKRMPNPERAERLGTLVASGLIVGESLWGVLNAGLIVAFAKDAPIALVAEDFVLAPWLGAAGFIAAIVGLYGWMLRRSAAAQKA